VKLRKEERASDSVKPKAREAQKKKNFVIQRWRLSYDILKLKLLFFFFFFAGFEFVVDEVLGVVLYVGWISVLFYWH
jgi:hypothetical protein